MFQCRLQKLEFLQWHPSVGRIQLNFSSGIPVWGCFNKVFPVVSQCTLGQPVAFQWHSSVHWTSQCTLAQGKGPLVYRNSSLRWINNILNKFIWIRVAPAKKYGGLKGNWKHDTTAFNCTYWYVISVIKLQSNWPLNLLKNLKVFVLTYVSVENVGQSLWNFCNIYNT